MNDTRALERDFDSVSGADFAGPIGLLPAYARGGDGPNGKPSFTSEWAGDYMTRPGWGPGAVVTYAFRLTAPSGMPDDTAGFTRFNAQQIAQAELALQSWSDVANITFVRVGGAGYSDSAQILFGNYSSGADGAAAFAEYPDVGSGGDAWFNSSLSYNANPQLWNYGRMTLVHEIGHALGLSHPGDYNAGVGSPTYSNNATYYEDTRQYSIMSYWSETNTGADFGGYYAAAPLLDDIAGIQSVYGANMTTRTGDTVYGFNSTAGRDFYSATSASAPVVFAVWDAGGFDTLDFSGYTQSQTIDLRQGAFSSVGGLTGNVAIATGAQIERAIGGSGADTMHAAANYVGGALPDLSKAQTQFNTSFATAVSLDGAFDLATDPRIAASDTTPHATVSAVGSGGVEYYVFTVQTPGVTVTFDIDGTAYGFDSFIRIYNAGGAQVASNDDGRGPGWTDSRATYFVATPGTYYVAVDDYGGGGVPAGAAYTLHVSVPGATATARTAVGSALEGRGGDDVLTGDLAADVLDGGTGNDQLFGGTGDDLLTGGDGNDRLEGQAGSDTAVYASASAGVTVDLRNSSAQATGGAGTDTLIGIENLTGSAFADRLTGDANDNTLAGGAGDDVLDGGAGGDALIGGDGIDEVRYLTAAGGVTVNLTTGVHAGDAAGDSFSSIERFLLSQHADQFTGSAASDEVDGHDGHDTLSGAAGNDRLTGGKGDDVLDGGAGDDVLDGGDGYDTAVYAGATSGVKVSLSLAGAQNTVGAGVDTLIRMNNLTGSAFADVLTGDAGANVLIGGKGDDVLDGGAGNDRLDGGDGYDTAVYAGATSGVKVNLSLTGAQNTGGAGTDTLVRMNNLTGSAFADVLTGDKGANVLIGGKGDDVLDGGAGNDRLDGGDGYDTAVYASATSGVTLNLSLTGAQNTVGAGVDTLILIENATGSAFADTLTGNAGANVLIGGKGDDVLDGGAGDDRLDGGDGYDTAVYAGASSGVKVDLSLTGAQNTGGAGVDTLIRMNNLTGSAFADVLIGDKGANVLIGGKGDDVLDGGAGNDRLDGGDGYDTAVYAGATSGVKVDLSLTGAQNTVGAGVDTLIRMNNLTGSAFADVLTGDKGTNVLIGGDGDDVLDGGTGNDRLEGGAGDDILTGGAGDDLFVFGPAFGHDRIDDFVAGGADDRLDFSAYAGSGVTWTLTQVGEDAVFTFSDGSTLTLAHVQTSSLNPAGDWGWG